MKSSKTCAKEKKRPKKKQEYKPKPKRMEPEYHEPEIHEIAGIKYIVLGNTPYAVDSKGVIDYAETKVLREILDKKV